MAFVKLFVIIMMIAIIVFYLKQYYGEIEYMTSDIDGRSYLVRKLPDRQQAADMLAEINKDCEKLIRHLKDKFKDNEDIRRLYKNFNPDNVSEGSNENGYTSYSINKGEKIILCIRHKDTNEIIEKNVLLYVTIHELAHLMTKEVGHTPSFWENFKFILTEAVEIGIYNKVDYAKSPVKYCGIKITSSII